MTEPATGVTDYTSDLPTAPPPVPALAPEVPATIDFFGGVSNTEKWFFPGQNEQYIEFNIMNEGQRKKYQRKISRDIKVDRRSDTAAIGVDQAGDRESLIMETVCGWYIINGNTGEPVPFDQTRDGKPTSGGTFRQWMDRADPRLIDRLEIAIRDANPWMQDDMDPESIQEEIKRLEKLYEDAVQRQEAKS